MKERSPATAQGCVRAEWLPSFFVVGPPRTGTSWLHEVLRKRAILPNPVKETRFFDLNFRRGLHWYLGHFGSAEGPNLPRGEVAPTYFASAAARRHIVTTVPHAKVVCIFRNPIDRIVSLYRLKRAYGMIPWNFEDALLRDEELIETSKYATHLKAWRQMLGESSILPMLYDHLREDPQRYVGTLARFLGLQPFTLSSAEIHHVHSSERLTHPRIYGITSAGSGLADWLKRRGLGRSVLALRKSVIGDLLLSGGRPFDELPAEVVRIVYELIRDEIEELETLINCDLSQWKDSSFEADRSVAPA